MIHSQLYNQLAPGKIVQAGVIGTGHFATATVTQAHRMARLDVPVVADINVEAARRAYILAGVDNADILLAENRADALAGIEQGKRVIVRDAMLLMDLPLDVIVESTGIAEVGACHAQAAIRHGKHVAMVDKETDVTVGPILARMAKEAGVVYTPVDGDQHGLLISMIEWARELGLEILCAGKARDSEYIYDTDAQTASSHRKSIHVDETELHWMGPIDTTSQREMRHHLEMRQSALAPLPQVGGFDLVEMAIVSNATGLLPDRPLGASSSAVNFSQRLGTDARLTNHGSADEGERRASLLGAQTLDPTDGLLHCPALHTSEIPSVLCPQEYGGILSNNGVIDSVTSLRLPFGAGLGGGVFLVVGCDNDYSRQILTRKGCLSNRDETTALIYRPYHLCGVETPISLLNAGLLGQSTLVDLPEQRVDVVARTNRNFAAGETIGNDHSTDLTFLMNLAEPVLGEAPVPIHMANGNRLAMDVPKGTVLTAAMMEEQQDSVLWTLRRQQDEG